MTVKKIKIIINLTLIISELAAAIIRCKVYEIEHKLNY